jgi:hypothetical protein
MSFSPIHFSLLPVDRQAGNPQQNLNDYSVGEEKGFHCLDFAAGFWLTAAAINATDVPLISWNNRPIHFSSNRGVAVEGSSQPLPISLAITVPRLGRVCALGPGSGFVFAHHLCSHINGVTQYVASRSDLASSLDQWRLEHPQLVSLDLTETSWLVTG